MSTTNNDAMSERRKRCEEWLLTEGLITGSADLTELSRSLEAFAKEQQIKGMERVKEIITKCEEDGALLKWLIDAAIAKLKLAGTQIDARNDREILGDLPATKEGG